MTFGNRKFYFGGSFKYSIVTIKKKLKNHPSRNLKFNNLGIFQSLKFRTLMQKNPFNFSSAKFNTECFGLLWVNAKMLKISNKRIY